MKIELRKKQYPHQYKLHPKQTHTILSNLGKNWWCGIHPMGRIGVNQTTGNQWIRCSIGYIKNEDCDFRCD